MRTQFHKSLAVLIMSGLCISGFSLNLLAQPEKAAEPKKSAAAPASTTLDAEDLAKIDQSSKRVPKNFGQIALSDEQRKKILDIQKINLSEIAKLEKEIEKIKEKNQAECDAVLTPIQKQLLENLREGSNLKKAQSKSATKKSS